MKLQLEVADRLRAVDVRRQPDGFEVVVDGRRHLVEAARVGPDTWSLIVNDADTGTRRSVEAVVSPSGGGAAHPGHGHGALDVHIDGQRVPVHLRGGLGRRARGGAGASGDGPQRVVAPMPGKVVRVLVAPGDEVRARQGLVVVEAMKMENELRAARDGRVREVPVREGQSVEAGTTLVIVE